MNADYRENCYELLDVLSNLGGKTLVSPEFFPFGEKLINSVASSLTRNDLSLSGNQCMEEAREKVMENDEVKRDFMDCCKESNLNLKEKEKIYGQLVVKVCNARFGSILKAYKDSTIGRQGTKRTDQSLRSKLKSVTSNEAGM